MKIGQLAEKILEYRKAKGLASATDLAETAKGLRGKVEELEQLIERSKASPQLTGEAKAILIDVLVWGIGGLGVVEAKDVWDALEARVAENATRTFSSEAAKS